jgi:hypothetical protein
VELGRRATIIAMLTYQIRDRYFRLPAGETLTFPSWAEVTFLLGPDQPFGEASDGGRTFVRGSPGRILFDGHTGIHTTECDNPLKPLEVLYTERWQDEPRDEPNRTVSLKGTELNIRQEFASLQELEGFIAGVVFMLPALLNLEFADPPFVKRIYGFVGEVSFSWELINWPMRFRVTSQDHQEQSFADSWQRLPLVAQFENRRLAAALRYYHTAVRLDRAGVSLGEFMAETLLNLSKCLEVLFPPETDQGARDTIRSGLEKLGYSGTEIERDFLPAVALRNEIDVGHVSLALFKRAQLTVIHRYTERAEEAFRELLKRILTEAADGSFQIAAYTDGTPTERTVRVIERMSEFFGATVHASDNDPAS